MFDWATDIHLDHATEHDISRFMSQIKKPMLVITGDIGNASTLEKNLNQLQEALKIPIYFVLGNHDFYGSSISTVRKIAKKYGYLRHKNVALGDTLLVGEDGWADGRAGDFYNSRILMNDFILIEELKDLTPKERLQVLQTISLESNLRMVRKLKAGFKKYNKIILATHVPPFHESCLYKGVKADNDWAPHFVNLDLGNRLFSLMQDLPHKNLTVLSGHTHNQATYSPLPNLTVVTGQAAYGKPEVQVWDPPFK